MLPCAHRSLPACLPPCLSSPPAPPQEHLFEQLEQLLSRALEEPEGREQLATVRLLGCKVEEIHTTLRKHLRKEEEQLLPLLLAHFSAGEQAELVAQFLCSIPLSTVEVRLHVCMRVRVRAPCARVPAHACLAFLIPLSLALSYCPAAESLWSLAYTLHCLPACICPASPAAAAAASAGLAEASGAPAGAGGASGAAAHRGC